MRIHNDDLPSVGVSNEQIEEMQAWQRKAYALLWAAARSGVVITINNPPHQPPAMGNYDLVVSVRPLRNYKDD